MSDCIFCKIVNKEIPATVVYESEEVLVFMDIGPIIKGHVLVIPKKHYDPVTETPDEILAEMHLTAKKIAAAQMNGLGADGVNIMQNNGKASGQEVEHIHIHVIPRFNNDGHHWNWNPKVYNDFEEMNDLAEKLQKQLNYE
ncbi:HIT family protein [Pontiella sp. NLcol2]|uniref:HIT family protein n=2 Tax=Pontiella agarivorans TaxID=3038953 RepID=A0ABU5MWH3_9BACT|nr:HIT family protein [Pontiella agarivorans]